MTTETTEPTPTTADPVVKPLNFAVKDFIDATQLKRDLAYSEADLGTAMSQQASLFAHYGQLAAQASHQVDVVKMLLESTEAAVYKLERDAAAKAGTKVTEVLLEKIVSRHSHVISMKKALNKAKQIEAMGKTAVEAFRHRRDMLVQRGLISREEMKGQLSIGAKSAHEEAFELKKQAVLRSIQESSQD